MFQGWRADDWIVVGTTDFAGYNSEFVKISSLTRAVGSLVTLASGPLGTPLVNYHFCGPAPSAGAASYTDGEDKNYGVDERAEVGLISRNIKLTAAIPARPRHEPALGRRDHVSQGFAGWHPGRRA